MTVYDFCELLVDDCMTLTIYDNNREKNVWTGPACEVPEVYGFEDVDSIDPPEETYSLTININF